MMVTAGLILSAGLSAPSDLAVAAGAQAESGSLHGLRTVTGSVVADKPFK